MDDASRATFRPTWRQALGRGLYLGSLTSAVAITLALVAHVTTLAVLPAWAWALLVAGPPVAGAVLAVPARRRSGIQISAGGIGTVSARGVESVATWDRVVDMRPERRGGRTVVSVYLDSGASVQLRAPYSGGLFAADPRFEAKTYALSYLWRSNRFGGLPG